MWHSRYLRYSLFYNYVPFSLVWTIGKNLRSLPSLFFQTTEYFIDNEELDYKRKGTGLSLVGHQTKAKWSPRHSASSETGSLNTSHPTFPSFVICQHRRWLRHRTRLSDRGFAPTHVVSIDSSSDTISYRANVFSTKKLLVRDRNFYLHFRILEYGQRRGLR